DGIHPGRQPRSHVCPARPGERVLALVPGRGMSTAPAPAENLQRSARSSLMNSHQVKEVMTRVGISEDQFRRLGLFPLIEVAWAEGRVQCAERSTLMRFAKRKGWLPEGGDALVDSWLKQRPSDSVFDETRAALAALVRDRRGLGNAFPEDTLSAVL